MVASFMHRRSVRATEPTPPSWTRHVHVEGPDDNEAGWASSRMVQAIVGRFGFTYQGDLVIVTPQPEAYPAYEEGVVFRSSEDLELALMAGQQAPRVVIWDGVPPPHETPFLVIPYKVL